MGHPLKVVQGSNNGVYVWQPMDVVMTQSGTHEIPWNFRFVFMPRDHVNFPLATGDLDLMKTLRGKIDHLIDNRAQGHPVPYSNGEISLSELKSESEEVRTGGVPEVMSFFRIGWLD